MNNLKWPNYKCAAFHLKLTTFSYYFCRMDYDQTLKYLYAQLPMFSRVGPAALKEGLDNTISLCNFLDNPQTKFKSIHIAGTNGKGSVSHILAAVLQQAGYKTGLYTSPHLKDFRERIKVNGTMMSKEFVVAFTERTKAVSDKLQPSFFEMTVAMAFEYFAIQNVDIAVIETGLGGRLDSTNIITPILSVITNIGYDHQHLLGNTLPEIASEKAGIIKKNIPVIVGEFLDETKNIFIDKAHQEHAPIYFAQNEFHILKIQQSNKILAVEIIDTENGQNKIYQLDLNGLYQTKNLLTVLTALKLIKQQGIIITDDAITKALSNVKKITGLRGRWDVIHENPLIALDVAHNEDGIKQILQQIAFIKEVGKIENFKLHWVIGMVKDKDISKVLQLLPADAHYYFSQAHIPRALPSEELQAKATTYGLSGNDFENVNAAIDAAKKNAEAEDIIIVCGSVFLIGEINEPIFNG